MRDLERVEGEGEGGRAWRGWTLRGKRHGLWVEQSPAGWRVTLWRAGELLAETLSPMAPAKGHGSEEKRRGAPPTPSSRSQAAARRTVEAPFTGLGASFDFAARS